MFVCTECKTKYQDKPEYCDCGNNLFEEVVDENNISDNDEYASFKKENVSKRKLLERYSGLERLTKTFDILSLSIFSICILLSILSWIFIGKDDSVHKTTHKNQHKVQLKAKSPKRIPNLNSFWNNSLPKENVSVPQQQQTPMATPMPAPTPIQAPTPRPVQVLPIPQVHRNQELIPTINRKDIVLPKKDIARPSKSINKVSSSIALNEYKGAIRQRLVSNLSVTSISGEGHCSVEFSVDGSGRLINRHFAKLSDNKSLNDAVYNMMMGTPRVSPPPPSYSGQPIRLSFYFNNGYYEVSY